MILSLCATRNPTCSDLISLAHVSFSKVTGKCHVSCKVRAHVFDRVAAGSNVKLHCSKSPQGDQTRLQRHMGKFLLWITLHLSRDLDKWDWRRKWVASNAVKACPHQLYGHPPSLLKEFYSRNIACMIMTGLFYAKFLPARGCANTKRRVVHWGAEAWTVYSKVG